MPLPNHITRIVAAIGPASESPEMLKRLMCAGMNVARLLTFPNVLITAHQAFLTREALSDSARTSVANLEALACGKARVAVSALT